MSNLAIGVGAIIVALAAAFYGLRERRRGIRRERELAGYVEQVGEMLECSKQFALAARISVKDVCAMLDKAIRDRVVYADAVAVFAQFGTKLRCTYATEGSRWERYVGRAEYDLYDDQMLPVAALRTGVLVTSKSGVKQIHPGDLCSVAVPLQLDHGNTSVVCVSSGVGSFDESAALIEMLSEQAEPALLLANEREEVESRATFDSLTGLLGRVAFDASLKQEIARAASVGGSVAVLYIDADGFKAWNDTFGHHAGDLVLQRLGEILSYSRMSDRDLAARRGGDEFCVAFVDLDKTAAIERAAEIGAAIAFDNRDALVPPEKADIETLPITASIGVAVFPRDADSFDALLHRADSNMYQAKGRGKARACYVGDDQQIHEVEVSASDRRDPDNRPFSDRRTAFSFVRGVAAVGGDLMEPARKLQIPTIDPEFEERDGHICYGVYPKGLQTIIHAALTYDRTMRMHLLSVNKLAWIWAERLGLTPIERQTFAAAALLHDIGKIMLPQPIILKPTRLSAEEVEIVREHVPLGERIIATEPGFELIARIVGQHHEWFNGGGYPRGLAGSEIEPLGRALSVVDAYSAMTDQRTYSEPMSSEAAIEELQRCADTQFDPYYVESFAAMKRSRSNR